jgi:hypothetical protein
MRKKWMNLLFDSGVVELGPEGCENVTPNVAKVEDAADIRRRG